MMSRPQADRTRCKTARRTIKPVHGSEYLAWKDTTVVCRKNLSRLWTSNDWNRQILTGSWNFTSQRRSLFTRSI